MDEKALFPLILRRLFTLTAAISTLLCVATAALWMRSYFAWDEFARQSASPLRLNPRYDGIRIRARYLVDHSSFTILDSFNGSLWLRWYDDRSTVRTSDSRIPKSWEWTTAAPGGSGSKPPLWGPFGLSRFQRTSNSHQWNMQLSDGTVCLGTAILARISLVLMRRDRHKRRQAAGLCRFCGYDVRASKDCCSECGRSIPERQKPAI
jgi:hypothetical protein